MKKNINKKQGFSLIELIVVIAVIAAIAAVIVPTIGNFSDSARTQSEKRNVQLWNSVYMQAKAAGANVAAPSNGKNLGAINVNVNVGGTNVEFQAAEVNLVDGSVVYNATTGVTYSENNS